MRTDFESLFKMIYDEWYTSLCNYAFRFINSSEEAEEIVQKAIIKLWDKREKIDKIDSLKPYLYRIVYNLSINHIEHSKVVEKYKTDAFFELSQIEWGNDSNDQDQLLIIEKALKHLPQRNQEVFRLRYFNGLKHKEIAEELNISSRTVETHILQGLKKIREYLKKIPFYLFFLYVIIIFQLL